MLEIKELEFLKSKTKNAKIKCLEMCVNAGIGHVTSAFSCAEIVTVLYYRIMNYDPNNPKWSERDRFVMSKNHGSVITYPILQDLGFVKQGDIDSFGKDGSIYGAHSKLSVPGTDFAGGSLGIGFGCSCGMSYVAKHTKKDWLTFCIVGDGEMYEGSIWESCMFAGANQLNNLVAIVDRNHMCVTDYTDKMLTQDPLKEKWEAFNWEVRIVDGHDLNEIVDVFEDVRSRTEDKPLCIIAETIKGKGISFMENRLFTHGIVPKGEQAEQAMKCVMEDYSE